jgi:uncharacterized iron-regulated membrane protein
MKTKIRISLILLVCLSLALTACQYRNRRIATQTSATQPAQVQEAAPTQPPGSTETTATGEPTATTMTLPPSQANPTTDSEAQDVLGSLDQLNQMNQAGDSFTDFP